MLPDDPVSTAEDLIAEGRAHEAAALLAASLAANRGGLLLRLMLQKALAADGDSTAALAAARESALLYPEAAPAALALGQALRASGHIPTAIGEFQRACRLDPDLLDARVALGAAWLDAGEGAKALGVWEAIPPEKRSPALGALMADAEQSLSKPRSDPRYVRQLFDQFSAGYDSRMLDQLAYRAPLILRELASLLGLGGRRQAILDLGCGTGLMGEAIKDWATRLEGVDLSPQMIEKARERGIYDELHVADLCPWLEHPGRQFALIFAADTFVYIGDLAPVFSAAETRLAPGGTFLFTTESKDDESFELGRKRRWRHSERYIRSVAEAAGLRVTGFMPCVPRREAGRPVQGFAVALAR